MSEMRFMELGGRLVNMLTVLVVEPFNPTTEKRIDAMMPPTMRDPELSVALEKPKEFITLRSAGGVYYLRETWENVKAKIAAARMGLDDDEGLR
jgi:hypothetical protein